MKKLLISIVIPSWFKEDQNGRYGLNETFSIANICLDRLLCTIKNRDDVEIIIIDNGSTLEFSDNLVCNYFSKADILIRNKENLGFGIAVNQGIEKATGEYIIQMNNDVFVFDGWLNALLNIYEKKFEKPIGLVMPNLIKREYQKDCLDEKGKLDFKKVISLKKEDIIMHNKEIIELHAQFGSLWMIKKDLAELLIKEDGFFFDPQFKIGFKEDRDLYQRLYMRGFETYRTNETRVYHIGNLTITKVENHKKYSIENKEKYERKWKDKII
jgi:GT2 family glycosyltransferase